jgi:hypothetical protein
MPINRGLEGNPQRGCTDRIWHCFIWLRLDLRLLNISLQVVPGEEYDFEE